MHGTLRRWITTAVRNSDIKQATQWADTRKDRAFSNPTSRLPKECTHSLTSWGSSTSFPCSATSRGGIRNGLPSRASFWRPVNMLKESGSTVIWLKLMFKSCKLCRLPIELGSSLSSVKLDDTSSLLKFGKKQRLWGTLSKWLKCTSKSVKLVREDMVVGKLLRLLRCTESRCNDFRWPTASGNAFNWLKSAFNSTSDVHRPIVHGSSSMEFFWMFRVVKLVRHPRASGNPLSWFDCTSRKVSLESSPIDSGKACNLFPVKQQKVLKFSDDYPQTIEFSNCYLACPCLPMGLSKMLPAQVGWGQSRRLIQKLWTHNPSRVGRQWRVVPNNCDQPTTKQLNQTWEDPCRRDHSEVKSYMLRLLQMLVVCTVLVSFSVVIF